MSINGINVDGLRTFKSLTAGSNVIMHNGTKLTFNGPLGGHGVFMTAKQEEIRYLQEVCRAANGAVWEEVPPEAEAALLAASEVIGTINKTKKDIEDMAAAAVNPTIIAMQAKLGQAAAIASMQQDPA